MSLVKKEDMTTLRSAADSRKTASTAEDDIQLQSVANVINNAANTGLYEVLYQTELRENIITELEKQGYSLKFTKNPYEEHRNVVISWKE